MQVRVATLNVWALPGPFAEKVGKRMKAIGARLASLELDAIAFQEAWTAEARGRLVEAGRRAGLRHAWHKDVALGGSGLLVLSRLPIERKRFDKFALRGLPERIDHGDYYGGKGYVQIQLRTGAAPLTLINTHLQARYSRDMHHEYRPHRAGQVVELAFAARETRDPIVVLGDFNFEEDQPEYAVLTGLTGMRDVAAELDRREVTVWSGNAYRRPHNRGKRVDFAFVRDGAQHAWSLRHVERVFDESIDIKGRRGSYSNHAGVLAELELSPSSSPLGSPDREAIALATRMLSEGRTEAEQRRRERRVWAGAGFGTAALAAAAVRSKLMTRRRLLRGSLQAAGLLALTPGVGLSILSEYFVPDEIRAYEILAARLAQLDRTADVAHFLA